MSKSEHYFYDHEAIKEIGVEPIRSREKGNGESAVDTKTRGYGCHCGNSGTRNKRSVWTVATKPFKKAHFATFPPKLIEPCILAGCPKGGTVIDIFCGSGTVPFVARENNRDWIGFDLSETYIEDIANPRIRNAEPQLF